MGAERADVELLTAIQRGDMGALEQIYDRHRVLAYSLALRVVGTPPDAEEVVQEAFLSVWRSAATYRSGSGSVRSWLLSIVRNRAIDRLRSRKSRPAAVALDDETDIPDRADVWGDVLNRLTGEEVRQAMAAIPVEQRQTIELAYFEGYTHAEIARMLDLPLGTVKGRMRIGLQKLRGLLEGTQAEMAVE